MTELFGSWSESIQANLPFALLVSVFVVGSVVVTVRRASRWRAFSRRAQPTRGMITDRRWRRRGQSPPICYPVLRFATLEGTKVETRAFMASGWRTKVGQTVDILYDPFDPATASLESAGRFFGAQYAAFGLALLAVGLAGLGTSGYLPSFVTSVSVVFMLVAVLVPMAVAD